MMNSSRNKVKSVIKKNFYKFTGILGFKSRDQKDQDQDEPNADVLSLPSTNIDNEIIVLERDEFDKRLNDFKSNYLLKYYQQQHQQQHQHQSTNNNNSNNMMNITLPNDLIHAIFISILSNTNMLIDTSQIIIQQYNNNKQHQHQQQHPTTNCEILSSIIPLMCGLTCSYITCTRTTTPEDLVQKLFDNNNNNNNNNNTTTNTSYSSLESGVGGSSSNGGNSPINNRINNNHGNNNNDQPQPSPTLFKKSAMTMVDILLVDDIDLAPLPTRYTLFQLMSYRKVAYKGKTFDTPEYFSVIATVSSFSNEFNQEPATTIAEEMYRQQHQAYPNGNGDVSRGGRKSTSAYQLMKEQQYHHIEPISPLILDNFFLNYRLYEPLNVPFMINHRNNINNNINDPTTTSTTTTTSTLQQPLHDPLISPQEQTQILTKRRLHRLRHLLATIYITNDMEQYIRTIIVNLRNHPLVTYGPSPRATPTLTLASKASALLSGQKFVTPTHVASVATLVLNHRIFLSNPFPLDNNNKQYQQYDHNQHPLHHQIKSMSATSTGQFPPRSSSNQLYERHSLNNTMDYLDKSISGHSLSNNTRSVSPLPGYSTTTTTTTNGSTTPSLDQLPSVIKSTSSNILSQATHLPPPPISIVDTDHDNNNHHHHHHHHHRHQHHNINSQQPLVQQVRMLSPITVQSDNGGGGDDGDGIGDDMDESYGGSGLFGGGGGDVDDKTIDSFSVIKIMLDNLSPPI